jgi:hypothetical protein
MGPQPRREEPVHRRWQHFRDFRQPEPDADVAAVLQTLDAMSGGPFADLDPLRRDGIAARLRETGGEALTHLTRIVLQCYYHDDRVMRSLGIEPRPPFPKGFAVEEGDWSLLDPVRARPKLYRDAG